MRLFTASFDQLTDLDKLQVVRATIHNLQSGIPVDEAKTQRQIERIRKTASEVYGIEV